MEIDFWANPAQWILGIVLILSALGVLTVRQPVHASFCFLLTLMSLAGLYLELSAQFISVMQVLIYAGAILVIFMFVIILFQDAHRQLAEYKPSSNKTFLIATSTVLLLSFVVLGRKVFGHLPEKTDLPINYGTVQSLGEALYVDFFFPFEALVLVFLVAVVGALYIAKKTS